MTSGTVPNKIAKHQTRRYVPCPDNLVITKTTHSSIIYFLFGPEVLEDSNLNHTSSILKQKDPTKDSKVSKFDNARYQVAQ